ncbi:MAG: DUF423 domain-containing protein [Elusimicrobiota bacterium]|nr:DUF423 domain-containing protein [Elusimicrobiota bacterium]
MNPDKAAAALGFLGVAMGAFGAHALKGKVDEELWRTAVSYQMWHALAAMAVAAPLAKNLFLLGVVVFSGTLYALALGAPRWLGAVTPVGGLLLLAGWAAVLFKKGGAAGDGLLKHFNL